MADQLKPSTKAMYFIVIAPDKKARVVTKRGNIKEGEVAIRLNVVFPPSWDGVIGDIDVTLPERAIDVQHDLVGGD